MAVGGAAVNPMLATNGAPPYNKGWPCYEGPSLTAQYKDLPGGEAACPRLLTPGVHSLPALYYTHPIVAAPLVSAISALAGDPVSGLVWYGDCAWWGLRRPPAREEERRPPTRARAIPSPPYPPHTHTTRRAHQMCSTG